MPSSPAPAANWPSLVAPEAPRLDQPIHQLGRTRYDAYAWMKFVPASGTRTLAQLPTPLREHLHAEMAYARQMLAPLAPSLDQFQARLQERTAELHAPLPLSASGWRYDVTQPSGHGHRVFSRRHATGLSQCLFDEAERARGHAYYRATDHQHSPDDRYFAWAEDVIGDDRHRLCILDMDSGQLQILVQADAFGYGGFSFSPSSRYLFWIWRDAHSRPTRLYRSPVEGGEAVLVYEEQDPALFMQVARSAAGRFIVLTLAGPDTSEVRLIPGGDETGEPRVVWPRQRGVRYEVNEWADALVVLTNADGAIDRKLLSLDPDSFAIRGEWVAHREGVPILSILPFAETLVRIERHAGLPQLILLQRDGTETCIGFEDPAYNLELVPAQPYHARQVRIIQQTPANPPRWLDIRLNDGTQQVVGQQHLRGFNPADYKVERLQARAADGESIPITLLSRSDAKADQPVLLTGYGAYGIANEANFSLPACVLVDSGFRYAIAHVRGGSEKGHRWYQAGCREQKHNSITDFIACAEHLRDSGYATPGKIVAHGISAGGLLVCAAMNRSPRLWAGVIAQVPFVDMLNTMSDAGHPLVPLLRPDWGDPLADAHAYDYIARLSPYENVHEAPYPPVLCSAGLKDDRVAYWEPAKLVANIRHHSSSQNPAILLLDPDSGHQQNDDQASEFAQAARLWAFARHCVGMLPTE